VKACSPSQPSLVFPTCMYMYVSHRRRISEERRQRQCFYGFSFPFYSTLYKHISESFV